MQGENSINFPNVIQNRVLQVKRLPSLSLCTAESAASCKITSPAQSVEFLLHVPWTPWQRSKSNFPNDWLEILRSAEHLLFISGRASVMCPCLFVPLQCVTKAPAPGRAEAKSTCQNSGRELWKEGFSWGRTVQFCNTALPWKCLFKACPEDL